LHPDQRTLPLDELAAAEEVYCYSFILTNCDVSTSARAAVEHWYRHRTEIENIFRNAKHGAALRHLPSGYAHVNRAWMWGALIARLVTPTHRRPRPRRRSAGLGCPRRQSHDRHPCDTDSSASPAGSSATPANSPCAYPILNSESSSSRYSSNRVRADTHAHVKAREAGLEEVRQR
jgi:hypothetical protein